MKSEPADRPANGSRDDSPRQGDTDRSALLREAGKPDFWGHNSNVKRWVGECLHSETQFDLVCTLGEHPKRSFSFQELAAYVSGSPSELGNAIVALEREGIATTRRQGRLLVASLAKSPVVRDMAKRLAHLSHQNEVRSALLRIVAK